MPQQLPLTVNLKDNDMLALGVGIIMTAAAAVFYKWWTVTVSQRKNGGRPKLREFVTWLGEEWITVTFAVAAAVGAVVYSKYLTIDSFTPADRFGLWTAVFTGVTAAALLTAAIGSMAKTDK